MSTTDKQLITVDLTAARQKVTSDQGLTLKELAVLIGIGYDKVRQFSRMDGFPMLGGYVFYSDFVIWRRQVIGLPDSRPVYINKTSGVGPTELSASGAQSSRPSWRHPRGASAGKFDAHPQKHD